MTEIRIIVCAKQIPDPEAPLSDVRGEGVWPAEFAQLAHAGLDRGELLGDEFRIGHVARSGSLR